MKFIAEKRQFNQRKICITFGRVREYDVTTEDEGYIIQVAFGLWFWAIGWKSEWRSK